MFIYCYPKEDIVEDEYYQAKIYARQLINWRSLMLTRLVLNAIVVVCSVLALLSGFLPSLKDNREDFLMVLWIFLVTPTKLGIFGYNLYKAAVVNFQMCWGANKEYDNFFYNFDSIGKKFENNRLSNEYTINWTTDWKNEDEENQTPLASIKETLCGRPELYSGFMDHKYEGIYR